MSADLSAIDAKELEALRRHGFGVAYRMLGSVTEAEDVAQEAHVGALVARFLVAVARMRRAFGEFEPRLVRVTGQPGRLLLIPDDRDWEVLSLDVVDGRIQAVRIVRNPDKLGHL